MPTHRDVQLQLARFETVEWLYDGLEGKVIPWTLERGGTADDPAAQVFVLNSRGELMGRAGPGAILCEPKAFARWLEMTADRHERDHPRSRMALVLADVVLGGEGTDVIAQCAALDTALARDLPVLVYFGREPAKKQDANERQETRATRRFERAVFDSETVAKAAKDWVRLRFDLSRPEHHRLAKQLGVQRAPALLLYTARAKAPVKISASSTGSTLASKLKKLAERD